MKKLRKNRETKVEQLRLALSRAICPSCGGYGNDPLKVIDSYEGTEYMCTDPYKIHVAFK